MIPLYTEIEFSNAKAHDKLPIKCELCEKTSFKWKSDIKKHLNKTNINRGKFCSRECMYKSRVFKIKLKCGNCSKDIEKTQSETNKTKNHFCSKSCAVTYNNTHKTVGNKRSKLEIWLEEKLSILYPNLEIHYNKKDTINSELDIYIPSLNLAFELNGIFHYEPIFGSDKLDQIQNNDDRKYQACLENKIELCIIDSSSLKYFKDKNCQKYLDIIANIINGKN
ncbi:MAG: hypothetical protein RLZZ546_1549 [Bacteroidota bacterium]|jgi:hypothetical protein